MLTFPVKISLLCPPGPEFIGINLRNSTRINISRH